MRRVRWGAALAVLMSSGPLFAQQGSLQITTATQISTGDPERRGGINTFEPDVGFALFQPGFRLGNLEIELHATRYGDSPHLGRTFGAIRDFKARGLTWSFEAGDTYLTPPITDYSFTNLFAPAVTFRGGAVSGFNQRTSITLTLGRTTVLRNILGTDPEALGQTTLLARAAHRLDAKTELFVHASRIRTTNVKEFTSPIQSSAGGGAGVRYLARPSLQVVADAGYTSFRRKGSPITENAPTLLAGARWTIARGWLQVDAQRLSPGDLTTLNYPFNDRKGAFAAGQYEFRPRLRVFGSVDVFKNNLDPSAAALSSVQGPQGTSSRGVGGVTTNIGERSFVTVRVEQGARQAKPSRFGPGFDTDTGVISTEWQARFNRWNAIGRYERRSNVDVSSLASTNTEHDVFAQIFYSLQGSNQVFASAMVIRRNDKAGGGQSFWQVSGGGQFQIPHRQLYARAEGTLSRTVDLQTSALTPRNALNAGLNGQLNARTMIAFDFFLDHSPVPIGHVSPWVTRSMVRLTYRLPTGTVRVAAPGAPAVLARAGRGTGTLSGFAYVDWNANGVQDRDEQLIGSIPFTLDGTAKVVSGDDGRFRFVNAQVGDHVVGLDLSALPADFDVPENASLAIEVARGKASEVSFGLIPVGTVQGGVFHDANGNGLLDEGDEPVDGAVLVLDGGARSELATTGKFRFESVRAGQHTLELLVDSLPAGALVGGQPKVEIKLTKDNMAPQVIFLVKLEKRPEIRKVFPPKVPKK
jgi:hypothetical protein